MYTSKIHITRIEFYIHDIIVWPTILGDRGWWMFVAVSVWEWLCWVPFDKMVSTVPIWQWRNGISNGDPGSYSNINETCLCSRGDGEHQTRRQAYSDDDCGFYRLCYSIRTAHVLSCLRRFMRIMNVFLVVLMIFRIIRGIGTIGGMLGTLYWTHITDNIIQRVWNIVGMRIK